ncbi:MAG TPA: hypothetical protein VHK27_11960, partial [Gammaproteobacteria bacterium]|nr:hypothetical protein [Gammaproteobacteria bacterium]
ITEAERKAGFFVPELPRLWYTTEEEKEAKFEAFLQAFPGRQCYLLPKIAPSVEAWQKCVKQGCGLRSRRLLETAGFQASKRHESNTSR